MENTSFLQGKTVCVAVSGGADSVALFYWLQTRRMQDGFSLRAVHCEHGIRGESSLRDMRFVQDLCRKTGVPLDVFSEDCTKKAIKEKISLETAARNFRKSCYEHILQTGKADYIATAHHQGDQAETVLFRLARGASLTGASGMKERGGRYLKPFLNKTKEDIYRLVKESGYGYQTDETNLEENATRNKLRLRVLPALEEAVPNGAQGLVRFARVAGEDDEYLYRLSDAFVVRERGGGYRVKRCMEKPLFRRACMTVLKELGKAKDVSLTLLDEAYRLQGLKTGDALSFKNGVVLKKEYDEIVFSLPGPSSEILPEIPFQTGTFAWGRYEIVIGEIDHGGLKLDRDALPANAVIRPMKTGDVIKKFGGGSKSVKKYLTDKKISADKRRTLPVVAAKDGNEVYLVGGVDIADGLKVTPATNRIVYFTLEETL